MRACVLPNAFMAICEHTRMLYASLVISLLLAAAPPTQAQYAGYITREIGTATAQVGDPVELDNVVSEDKTVTGARMFGTVTHVVRAGQGTRAELAIRFTKLTLASGASYAIDGTVTGMQANTKPNTAKEILGAVGGLLAGNAIYKVFGGHGGTGGFIGASAGYLLATNSKENMTVPQGSVVRTEVTVTRRQSG